MEILKKFKEKAIEAASNRNVEFIGIATAVFRKAENGKEVLEKFEQEMGIRFHILQQEEEGKLGFFTAKTLFPGISDEDLLAWDSGNGSFQITAQEGGNFQSYLGPLGHGTVRVLLSKEIRNMPVLQAHESGNPVYRDEAIALADKIKKILPIVPDWLRGKLDSSKTITASFGDGESIFALVAEAVNGGPVQQAMFTLTDVQKVIDTYIEQDDSVFDAAGLHRKTLTSALLLATVMKHFGIETVHYSRSVGSTSGMLIDPGLWIIK